MIPKPDDVCKTVKVILEGARQKRNYSELVFKMDNISVIKVTWIVIVSMYVTLTETLKVVTAYIKS